MSKHGSILLYVHGGHKARQDGQPRTATSTLTQLLNYGQHPSSRTGDKSSEDGVWLLVWRGAGNPLTLWNASVNVQLHRPGGPQ